MMTFMSMKKIIIKLIIYDNRTVELLNLKK